MSQFKSMEKIISDAADVLIVGGGLAGLSAAITVKEKNPKLDVLVVEKATSGWSGKADRGGGILAYLTPEDTPEELIRFHVREIGCFLEDQELLSEIAHTLNSVADNLDKWGVRINKEKDGGYQYLKYPESNVPWGLVGVDLDMCRRLNKRARKLGTRFVNKATLVDLLKTDNRVTGAIGFGIEDGGCRLVRAKATILANGGQNYRIMPMWGCGRGDGIAAAYRAGAQMRNAEFSNMTCMVHALSREEIYGAENNMYNAKGEDISAKYRPAPQPDICGMTSVGWYKEHVNGNGPVRVKKEECLLGVGSEILFTTDLIWKRPKANAFWSLLWDKAREIEAGDDLDMPEIMPGFIGEMTPVRVDHDMATSLAGLYAAGDICWSGSGWIGAVPPPGRMRGTGYGNAVWTAHRAGLSAARYAAGLDALPQIDTDQIDVLKARMFAPMFREKGFSALDLLPEIHSAITPVRYSGWKSAARMQEALAIILKVKEKLSQLKAAHPHDLARCNEAASMVLCAEMFYRASLERKESRGWFVREDYPATDNENWLKWIILENKGNEMVISTERVPIERYPIKP